MRALIGLVLGLFISLSLCLFAGENPWHVFLVLTRSAFGSSYDLGLTLFYTTSLIFTGLAVAVAFHGGLFNIGAEGQLTIATITAAITPLLFPELSGVPAFLIMATAGLTAGFLWGLIPGWLKATRDSHEVIVTMMMNFIAAGIASYLALEHFRNMDSQNPETAPVPEAYLFRSWDPIQKMFPDALVNFSVLIALLLCLLTWIFLTKTKWGFELKAAGQNPTSARFAGISSKKWQVLAMALGGFFAAFVALNEVAGSAGKFRLGFSADYGFVGIAVALMARNHPLAIPLTAFLFGALQKGAADLDLETEAITRDFARVIQGVLIFSIAGLAMVNWKILDLKNFTSRKRSPQ